MTTIQAATADAKSALKVAFENFSTTPTELATEMKINTRYARELLGLLVKSGLAVDTEVNGSDQVWQSVKTYDHHTWIEVEADFDRIFTVEATPTAAAKARRTGTETATNPAGLPSCLCGCGGVTNRNRNYRPGHDARHAGNVGRAVAAAAPADRKALLDALPTDALKAKALKVAEKPAKGSRKASQPQPVRGQVKSGRWSYKAQREADGTVVYNDKKGASHIASAKVAATFVAE